MVIRFTGDVSQHGRQAQEAVEELDRFRKPIERQFALAAVPIYVGWRGYR